ncbi:MAG: PH domain-containing protein [Chloroflexota bacterium]|nr:PH domain-containing protein [Chloroflexota bacterium]MDE2899375.1 PH domain-containing protein [Chloroflexota bacterium]
MQSDQPGVTGKTLRDAQFDRRVIAYWRVSVSLVMVITIVGIPFIPFWLIYSLWFGPKYFDGLAARLTTQALELRKGVFTRNESTIPLNRITDLKLHQGPLMRRFNLHGLKVETAGQSGPYAGSEGNLLGVMDAETFRNAILRQRQITLGAEPANETSSVAAPAGDATQLLTEIRDILARIEAKQ